MEQNRLIDTGALLINHEWDDNNTNLNNECVCLNVFGMEGKVHTNAKSLLQWETKGDF